MKPWKQWSLGLLLTVGMGCSTGSIVVNECTGVEDGTACDNGNGTCQGGICARTKLECDGKPDGTPCSHHTGTCQSGICGPLETCKAPNSLVCGTSCCNPDTQVCDATGNRCEVPPFCRGKPNGTPCNNNTGTCQEGECNPLCTPGILQLTVEPPSPALLSPIDMDTTLSVRVACLANREDAGKAVLDIVSLPEGVVLLSTQDNGVVEEMGAFTRSSSLTLRYNGTEAFSTGLAAVPFELGIPAGHVLRDRSGNPLELSGKMEVGIRDGRAKTPERVIGVNKANIQRFNSYARTGGLARHYVLTENVTLPSESHWTPIGDSSISPFVGSFDGGGNTLSGLSLDSANLNYQGMFGYVSAGAIIENLGLIDVNARGYSYVGSLVGYSLNSTVQNCYAKGGYVRGYSYVGGLVGYNYSSSTGTVQNSYAQVDVTGTNDYVGGLVGCSYGWWGATNRVQNSYATGTVIGNGRYVGGLVGWFSGEGGSTNTVQNSYATGSVTGTGRYVGGLVGWLGSNSTVRNSYATGNVIGTGDSVGGLVGCNNDSWVETSYAAGAVEGNSEVGGLVGLNGRFVQINMALNPSVRGTSNTGRVVGLNNTSGTLLNNLAFDGMLNQAGTTDWLNISPNGLDGANRSAGQLRNKEGFHDIFVDPSPASPWTYQPGRLPGLFGQTVAMPAYLQ